MAAAIAPFALGDELSIEINGLEQAAPVAVAGVFDARFEGACLIRSAVNRGGLCALAENGARGQQSVEGDQ